MASKQPEKQLKIIGTGRMFLGPLVKERKTTEVICIDTLRSEENSEHSHDIVLNLLDEDSDTNIGNDTPPKPTRPLRKAIEVRKS